MKYAVLCKTRGDLMDKVDGEEQKAAQVNHKGTGFVNFLKKEDADALLELS